MSASPVSNQASRQGLQRFLPPLIGIGLFGAAIWGCLRFADNAWMPVPASLYRYNCPNGVHIEYRHGANSMKIASAQGSASAIVQYDELEWDDYAESSKQLGFAAPRAIKFGGSRVIHLTGGDLDGKDCSAE